MQIRRLIEVRSTRCCRHHHIDVYKMRRIFCRCKSCCPSENCDSERRGSAECYYLFSFLVFVTTRTEYAHWFLLRSLILLLEFSLLAGLNKLLFHVFFQSKRSVLLCRRKQFGWSLRMQCLCCLAIALLHSSLHCSVRMDSLKSS